jgi:ABC-2 type transport system permease protein
MAVKEVMHILRDRQVLIYAFGMPLTLLLLFGYAVSFDIENIPLAVCDQDHTERSRALERAFSASGTFEVVTRISDCREAERLFRNGAARAALVVPEGFERALVRGEESPAQLLLDGADGTTANVALGYAQAISLAQSQIELERALATLGGQGQGPLLSVRLRALFNPGLRSSVFLVPGLIVVILVMVAVMLTALTVAREYERGSMEQLFATPVGRLEVVLGKLGPYFVIGLVQVLLVLAVGVTLFGVPVRGSLPLLFGVSSLFLLAMLMQGLFISAVARNQMVASQVAAMSTFLPALLLSGFVFPIENMPLLLQGISAVLPARYFVHALRAVLLRGNSIADVAVDLAAMAAFFLVMLSLAVRRFQRTIA